MALRVQNLNHRRRRRLPLNPKNNAYTNFPASCWDRRRESRFASSANPGQVGAYCVET
nr:MAG TPA: hypothetical protein [Caudoviricetes sp.]